MIQQFKCNINFFHRQYYCLTLLLCCIFFLFSINFSKAEEIPSDDTKTEIKQSPSKIYVVNGTSVANIDQIQGVKEVTYVESKKKEAPKAKKQKKTPKINAIVSVQAPDTSKREEKTFITKVSPINNDGTFHSGARKIVAAITTLPGKANNKLKLTEKNNLYLSVVFLNTENNFIEEYLYSFAIKTYIFLTQSIRPPPVG